MTYGSTYMLPTRSRKYFEARDLIKKYRVGN